MSTGIRMHPRAKLIPRAALAIATVIDKEPDYSVINFTHLLLLMIENFVDRQDGIDTVTVDLSHTTAMYILDDTQRDRCIQYVTAIYETEDVRLCTDTEMRCAVLDSARTYSGYELRQDREIAEVDS